MRQVAILIGVAVYLTGCMQTPKSVEPDPRFKSWKTGQFYYYDQPFGLFLMNRNDTLQEEFIRSNGILTEFDIKWLNDSTYRLHFSKVVENPRNVTLPKDLDSLIKTCTITQLSDTSYVERATTNLNNDVHLTTIYSPKIKKDIKK